MGSSLATDDIRQFLEQLSRHYSQPITLYLLGGSALCFLGNPRRTVDIDCAVDNPPEGFEAAIEEVANDLNLEVEILSLDEFIPLPAEAPKRHQLVGKFGSLEVHIFDPYSIAISKIARGFETDIQDTLFLLNNDVISFDKLAQFVNSAALIAWDYDIDPKEMRRHLNVVKGLLF
jgi:hypothetical protein